MYNIRATLAPFNTSPVDHLCIDWYWIKSHISQHIRNNPTIYSSSLFLSLCYYVMRLINSILHKHTHEPCKSCSPAPLTPCTVRSRTACGAQYQGNKRDCELTPQQVYGEWKERQHICKVLDCVYGVGDTNVYICLCDSRKLTFLVHVTM